MNKSVLRRWVGVFGCIVIMAWCGVSWVHAKSKQSTSRSSVVVLRLQGAIGPAVSDYIQQSIQEANQQHAAAVWINMDTPGGLDSSMRDIIKSILSSSIPVITYVSPSGARAASAGTYILYASHVAAMSPGTNLGAATPVSLAPSSSPTPTKEKGVKPVLTAKEKKVINDASAYIRSLAQLRGRNEAWAVKAVTDGQSMSSKEALKRGVIDYVASSRQDLVQQLQGKKIKINDQVQTLKTAGWQWVDKSPNWRTEFLMVITNPAVAYILLMVAFYGLFFEFSNPGVIIPGVVGAIAALLALYALQMLPVNYVGLGLIVLGLGFMTAEALMPSVGVLGIGGVFAFVVGSILLYDKQSLGYQISHAVVITMTGITVLFFLLVFQLVVRSQRTRLVSGESILVGRTGVIVWEQGVPWVEIQGELWLVKGDGSQLHSGAEVDIIKVDGRELTVRLKKQGE